jgi:acetyl esterase/lipase
MRRAAVAVSIFLAACGGSNNPTEPSGVTPPSNPNAAVLAKLGTQQVNVTYCSPSGVNQLLDIYYPTIAPASGRFPVIVYIHGGQLIKGNKGAQAGTPAGMWRMPAAARGYVFVSINYRLGPTYRFPAMLEDSKCAIRFLRATAATTLIDADRIGVTGTSSGGSLSAMVATISPSAGAEGTGGYDGVSSRVRAAVIEYGADLNLTQPPFSGAELEGRQEGFPNPLTPSVIALGTVVNHVSSDDPPFFLIHGDKDTLVDSQDMIDLNNALRSVGVTSSFRYVTNGVHGWDSTPFGPISPSWDQILQMELDFFDQHLK